MIAATLLLGVQIGLMIAMAIIALEHYLRKRGIIRGDKRSS